MTTVKGEKFFIKFSLSWEGLRHQPKRKGTQVPILVLPRPCRVPTPGSKALDWRNFFLFLAMLCSMCGILVPRPGIKPAPLALEAWSLNPWTVREVRLGTLEALSTHGSNPRLPADRVHLLLRPPKSQVAPSSAYPAHLSHREAMKRGATPQLSGPGHQLLLSVTPGC